MGNDNGSPAPETVPLKRFLRANCCNRFCTFFVLLIIIACSGYFNYTLVQLTQELKGDEAEVNALRATVSKQQLVIDRFNQSVTNSDVLHKVTTLEQELYTTENEMNEKMKKSQETVSKLLNATLDELATTVAQAKREIRTDVLQVKQDVAKYANETNDKFNMENSFMIWQLAGTFTLIACLISMWHMTAHLRKFRKPSVQRKILAILWMSPIYGITSWLSLVFPSVEAYFAIVKDFYEAYIIYQFLSFLISVLGKGNRAVVVNLLTRHADHLEPPYRLCGCCTPDPYDTPKKKADAVLLQCQAFAMQFVFFKPMTTIGIFLCKKYYHMPADTPNYLSPKFWLIVVQNISVFLAFSGLLKFYHAVQDDLAWCRPFPKFLCIKGIVFMTFWQGLCIAILAQTTRHNVRDDSGSEKWAKQAQNFLVCLEMLLFSIAHFYCFPTEEWEDGYQPNNKPDSKFGDNLALSDFLDDLKLIVKGNRKKKKIKGYSLDDSSVSTPETVQEAANESSPLMKADSFDLDDSHHNTVQSKSTKSNENLKRQQSIKLLEKTLQSIEYDSDSDDDTEMGMTKKQLDSNSVHNYDDDVKKIPAAYGSLDSSYKNATYERKEVTIQSGDSLAEKVNQDHYSSVTETTSLLSPLLQTVDPPIDNNVSSNKIEDPFRSSKTAESIDTKKDDYSRIDVDENKESLSNVVMDGIVKPHHEIKNEKDDRIVSSVHEPAEGNSFVFVETNLVEKKQVDIEKYNYHCKDEDSHLAQNVTDFEKKPADIEKGDYDCKNEDSHLAKNVADFRIDSVQEMEPKETTSGQNSGTSELLQPSIFTMHSNM